jgi:spore coat polysaccharide biosynthesis protein SpsF
VATTTEVEDNPIENLCIEKGFSCFRGNTFDVLDRYYQAATLYKAGIIVRLTADCPLIDPGEIDRTIRAFMKAKVDFTANRLPPPFKRTTPIGLDTEVCTFETLKKAWENSKKEYEREHVMPYIYGRPDKFKIMVVDMEPDYGDLRWTVDTIEDLNVIREIFTFFKNDDGFDLTELIEASKNHPEWQSMNFGVKHKSFYDIDERCETDSNQA